MTVLSEPKPVAVPRPPGGNEEASCRLADLSRASWALETLESVFLGALSDLAQAVDASAAWLFGLADDGETLVRRAGFGETMEFDTLAGPSLPKVQRCLTELRTKTWLRAGSGQEPEAAGPLSLVCLPLVLGNCRLGAVVLADRRGALFSAADLHVLKAALTPLALGLSNLDLGTAVAAQAGVRRELDLAAEIQCNLLPGSTPGGFPVHGLNRPIRKVSGDFFDYFPLDQGRIPFALGDVSGKGINAALLMAKVASLFRCLAKRIDDPAGLLELINREICETASHGMFVTMVAGLYDTSTGRVRFANAGHEPPLLRLPDRSYKSFPAEAPPLGILPDLGFETREIDLEGGEFYLFSDGLTEYRYGTREALGVDGLVQLIEILAEMPLAERLGALLAELDDEGWEVRDDLTVLAIDDAWVRRHD